MAGTKQSVRDKNELTTEVARSIIASETNARDRKTEKLRQMRLEAEAAATPEPVKAKPAKAPAKARRAKTAT